MPFGEFPKALGVLYCDPAPSFEAEVHIQNERITAGRSGDLGALLSKGQGWDVKPARGPNL
jgi:2-oxoglutarate ferredoxin oxidoreductase subunit beta